MLNNTKWDAPIVQPLLPEQQILLDAADLLEKDGWCQGQSRDISGRHCAVGAIVAVPGSETARYQARRRLGAMLHMLHMNYVFAWNDSPDRTEEEVVAAMREAAR